MLAAVCFAAPDSSSAQVTNREVMISLVSTCLAPAIEDESTLSYTYRGSESFVEAGVVAGWLQDGKSVSIFSGGDSQPAVSHLDFSVTDLDVAYERASKHTVGRTVSVVVMGTHRNSDDQILHAIDCPASFEDVLDRNSLSLVEDTELEVTTAEHPSQGVIRKYVQPVIVGAASAVTVYLFFTIRSSNDSSSS